MYINKSVIEIHTHTCIYYINSYTYIRIIVVISQIFIKEKEEEMKQLKQKNSYVNREATEKQT